MIEKDKATLMHQECGSIVGLAEEQTTIESPLASVFPEQAQIVKRSAEELIPNILSGRQWQVKACVKVFNTREGQRIRLLLSFGEPLNNHLWVVPGKMTASPFVAAEVFNKVVWKKLQLGTSVQPRPLGLFVESLRG
ncbi:MAG: hypothetical protein ACHBNF_07225 [Chromatiales bacterium]